MKRKEECICVGEIDLEALDEGGEARTTANRPAFLSQTLVFSGQAFFSGLFWFGNLPQER
jgi:hypothetical protein